MEAYCELPTQFKICFCERTVVLQHGRPFFVMRPVSLKIFGVDIASIHVK